MSITGILSALQLLVLLATLPIFIVSRRTSRGRTSQQRSYLAVAAVLGLLALLGVLITWPAIVESTDADYWLVLGPPAVTLVLCLLIVRRSLEAGPASKRSLPL